MGDAQLKEQDPLAQQSLRMAAMETAGTEGREGTCSSLGGKLLM